MKKLIFIIVSAVVAFILFAFVYMGFFFHRMAVVTTGAPITREAEDRPALLVIDIQEGITGQSAPQFNRNMVRQSGAFIQAVNAAIDKAQARQIPVIYIRQETIDPIANFLTGGKFLKAGTPPTALDPRVKAVPGPTYIKHVMDAFSNPELDAYLRSLNVNHLYMTGLDASQCVDRTIKGALQRGYTVTALADALLSGTVEKKEGMLKQYQQEGVRLMSVDQWQ
ncbi:MAG: cysteine hydrolase [candidate division FCPU426 bacterium]